ncbi:MAG: family transcriptional regulator, cyclic receptor protein [Frankiales bacterium]|jgi:CRP-like cAMP-binding protein|nr:family transcriptional regulator, cyclic receptor protein [Frankiales bacterium]
MSSAAPQPDSATPLTALAVFDRCPPERLAAIEPSPEELEVELGEAIVREGHLDHEWYVILDGEASVSTAGHVLGVLGPGEHFGEIAILSRQPRRFTVRALTPMRVLMLTEEAFLALLDDCAPFGRTLLVRLTRRMSSLAESESSLVPTQDAVTNDHLPGPHPSTATHLD